MGKIMVRAFNLLTLATLLTIAASASTETFTFGRFGEVAVYRNSPRPGQVVLFVSGDGGWNAGVIDMAQDFAELDALVLGIDIRTFYKALAQPGEPCSYPAADFEQLSQFAQRKLGYQEYVRPLLVGYSSGATLVYALLAQAPPGTFAGAVSMGFCPDLPLSRPLCRGSGLESNPLPKGTGYSFAPAEHLSNPWVAFQGLIDQVCDPRMVERFDSQTPHAELVSLPKVGHGFSVPHNWLPQLRDTFKKLSAPESKAALPTALADLPLIELPAAAGAPPGDLVVILSGDGGWAGLDRQLGEAFSSSGHPVAGLDSLRYFWKARTEPEASADLERIIQHYLQAWGRQKVVLVGYSLGADVLPALAAGLSSATRQTIAAIALLGPGTSYALEFHLGDWLGLSRADLKPILPEVEKLSGTSILCFSGSQEGDSLCPKLPARLAVSIQLPGGHHFDGDYEGIAREIMRRTAH